MNQVIILSVVTLFRLGINKLFWVCFQLRPSRSARFAGFERSQVSGDQVRPDAAQLHRRRRRRPQQRDPRVDRLTRSFRSEKRSGLYQVCFLKSSSCLNLNFQKKM